MRCTVMTHRIVEHAAGGTRCVFVGHVFDETAGRPDPDHLVTVVDHRDLPAREAVIYAVAVLRLDRASKNSAGGTLM